MKNLSSNDKKCVYGIILSCVIMVFGILFLVNAMGVANFCKISCRHFSNGNGHYAVFKRRAAL